MIAQGLPKSQVPVPPSFLISGLPRTWRTSRQVTISSSIWPRKLVREVKQDSTQASVLQHPVQPSKILQASLADSPTLQIMQQEGHSPSTIPETSHQDRPSSLSAYSQLLLKKAQDSLDRPNILEDRNSIKYDSSSTSRSSDNGSQPGGSGSISGGGSLDAASPNNSSYAATVNRMQSDTAALPQLMINSKLLTSLLVAADNLIDLWALHQQHHKRYDHIHVCTVAYTLAHMARTVTERPATTALGPDSGSISSNIETNNRHGIPSTSAGSILQQELSRSSIITTILKDLMQALLTSLHSVDPDAAATLLWSLAQLRYTERTGQVRRCPTVEALAQIIARAAVSELGSSPEALPAASITDGVHARPHILTIQPPHLVMAVWAIAKLGLNQRWLWDAIVPRVVGLPDLKSRDLANVMWSLATVNYSDPEAFNHLSSRAVKLLWDCNGQDLSSMVWAMARVDQPHRPLLIAAQKAILALPAQRLTGQNASNFLWGLATLHAPLEPSLLQHLALVPRMRSPGHMTGGHLAQILWATVRLGVCDAEILEAASSGLVLAMKQDFLHSRKSLEFEVQQAGGLTSRELCMAAWAAATMGLSIEDAEHGAFVRQLHRSLSGLDSAQLAPQGVVMALWSLAKMRAYDQDLFERLAASMKPNVYKYEAQQLSMILWALATTNHRTSPTAVAAAAASVESILPRFKPQELSVVASSLAELGCYSPTLFDAMALHLTETHGLSPHERMQQQISKQALERKEQRRKDRYLSWQQQQQQQHGMLSQSTEHVSQTIAEQMPSSPDTVTAFPDSDDSEAATPASTSLQEAQHFQSGGMLQLLKAQSMNRIRVPANRGGIKQLPMKLRPDLHRLPWSLVNRLKPMEVAKVFWAYASVGHVDETLFETLTLAVSRMLRAGDQGILHTNSPAPALADDEDNPEPESFQQHDTANSSSSSRGRKSGSYRGGSSSGHTAAVATAADHFSLLGPGVSRLLWAYATLGHQESPVFAALVKRAVHLLPSLTPQDVAAVTDAVSMSGEGEQEERLVYGCVGMLLHRPQLYTVSQSVSVLLAAATVSIDNPGLITHVTQQMSHDPDDLSPRSWSDALHALMILTHRDDALMDQLLATNSLLPAASSGSGPASDLLMAADVDSLKGSSTGNGNSSTSSSSVVGASFVQAQTSTAFSPSQLVTVLTCLCSFSHPHTAFLVQAARFLVSQLDLLMVDELISLAWVCGMAILPRPPNPVSVTQALASNHKHLPAICNESGEGGEAGGGLQAVLDLLRAIRSLISVDKPDTLLRPELMLLAQATIAAGDWEAATSSAAAAAAAAARIAEEATASPADVHAAHLSATAMPGIFTTQQPVLKRKSDFQWERLHPLHLPRGMHEAALAAWGGRARQGGARRLQIEIATALTAAGYTASIDVRSEDDCVPIDVEGEMGDRRVALVLMGGKGTNATGQQAGSQRQAAVLQAQVAMLRLRGYWVFDMHASVWSALRTPEKKLAHLKQQLPPVEE